MTAKAMSSILAVLLLLALSACASATDDAGASPSSGEDTLRFTGLVETEQAYTVEDLRSMDSKTVESANKEGKAVVHTGVALSQLLQAVGARDDADGAVFVGSDGYESEVSMDELQGCADCIVAIQDDGTFMNVMPGFALNTQVRELVEVRIQ